MKPRFNSTGRSDKRKFSKHAAKQHVRNLPSRPMRGGIRL